MKKRDIIIQRSFAAKQDADLQEEDRKNIESLQSKFGLDVNSSPPPTEDSDRGAPRPGRDENTSGSSNNTGDLTQTNEILERIDSRLHGSPDYLETLNNKIDTLIKDDPSSLDIENQREQKRHQKKMEKLSQNQIKATKSGAGMNAAGGAKGSKISGVMGLLGVVGDALSAYGLVKGGGAIKDMFSKPSLDVDPKVDPKDPKKTTGPDPKNTEAPKKQSKLGKLFNSLKNIPKVGTLVKGAAALGAAVTVADVVSDVATSTGAAKPAAADPVVTGRPAPQIAENKPGLLSKAKTAIAEKMPFKSTTTPTPNVPTRSATVGRGPDGRFTKLIPDVLPEVTKPAGAGRSIVGGLKTAGKFVGKGAVPLTVALGAMEAGSILMDDEMTGDQKVNAGAKLAGGTGGAMAGAAAGAAIMAPLAPFTLGLSSLAGGLIGGALGYMGGETLGGMGADAAGFSETATEEELIEEKRLKNDKRLVEIQDELMEAGDRMARSKSGENVYYGREHKGIEEDEQKIKELKEELDRLNITAKKPEVKPESKMPNEGDVEPRPDKNFLGGDAGQKKWDKMYGKTHNNDGTLKKVPENVGKVEMSAEELNKSSALGIGFNGKTNSMSEKTEGITEKYFGKEMTHQELEDGIKSGSVKRSIGRKLQKKIVMRSKRDHPERFVLSPEEETARQEVMQSMPSQNVSASDTAVNNKVAAGETLKSSALNQGNKNSNNNVVGNNNTSNTSVTNNTQNVKRVDNGGVRNPDPAATRARIGLGMGMSF